MWGEGMLLTLQTGFQSQSFLFYLHKISLANLMQPGILTLIIYSP